MNKHPKYLKPQDTPTMTQRKTLKLGPPCKPAPRHPLAAGSREWVNASMEAVYRPGDGEVGPVRVRVRWEHGVASGISED